MIRSMTGFGEAERESPAGRIRAEIRTVNHRYFSGNLRLAPAFERFEPQLRETLRGFFPRGHVNFSLRWAAAGSADGGAPLVLDQDRARGYLQALQELKTSLHLPGEIDVALLSRFGDVFRPADAGAAAERVALEDLIAVTEAAARLATGMRIEEGRKLQHDLEGRIDAIEAALETIVTRAPARLVSERDRMRRVVSELAGEVGVDEDRLTREIAWLAERLDISEEVVRLRSHVELVRRTIAADDEEPVGKRLGFVVQEMHRETNTIGSKANDAEIEHRVIAIKEELERLREQLENIE